MNVRTLLKSLTIQSSNCRLDDIDITHIACDSRKVDKGSLFIAIRGHEADGHTYIKEAVENGASLVIGEHEADDYFDMPYIQVGDSRRALAVISKNYYMKDKPYPIMIGITGTNGKTTTSFMIRHILEQSGYSCALFGTVSYMINKKDHPSTHSTPDPMTLHKFLADSEDDVAILEVSSHGIKQGRIHGVPFDHLVFTNLGHDHLDYHSSMEDYFETKASLFDQLTEDGTAVIYTGQDWGKTLAQRLKQRNHHVWTVDSNETDDAIFDFEQQLLHTKDRKVPINLQLPGIHNFHNASFAAVTSNRVGVEWENISRSLSQRIHVPGRFERYSHPNGATIVVDYAHTSDAIENILATAKREGAGNIIHVFGFRGKRDKSKQKEMLHASKAHATEYVLTRDDLNGIDPSEMDAELEDLHFTDGSIKGTVLPDRTKAIKYAWDKAKADDWIIITGKGHEEYKDAYHYPVNSDIESVEWFNRQSECCDPILKQG
ncbi:UDP-N-acetylmuramoyl-L-alanyl-D-glutamate--2,6-diaminopimelate ligase [Thalassobacillus hwangdonensis]|uniref:UDP-N-acetylmuramoyl-L-alanyl-D-glutamate--2, 6-diaminopimelate ligase n=1 Tax=Thalassobacillus hwangdonensis TaxID=546108 RepID=A0ABW3L5P0_9BACI